MSRIQATDPVTKAIERMSENNFGALSVLTRLVKYANAVDPAVAVQSFYLYQLDQVGIYGSDIWILYKDICDESLVKVMAVLRAIQLGIIKPKEIQQPIDLLRAGGWATIPDVDKILDQVQDKLPTFSREEPNDD